MDVSVLIRLIDQFSGPAQKVRDSAQGISNTIKDIAGGAKEGFSNALKNSFSVENIEAATKNAEQALTRARGRLLGAAGMALTLGGPVKLAAGFETEMNRVKALTNATDEQFNKLRSQALYLGRMTQFTTRQAADAQGFLAMAGFKTNEIYEAMPGTLQLAASAQLDLAKAADIVTNILTGYQKKGTELGHVNDVLVKAFTSANTDLVQLAEAMKYAAPVASSAGVEFEETTAALALMGNAGIQASMAGTGLRGAITRMLSPTKGVREAMEEANLTFTDSKGRLLPLLDIIKQLEPHADNTGMMMKIFGQRAGPAMMALISQGSGSLEKLTDELKNSAGTAERVSKVQMEGFNGMLKELQSSAEGTAIALGTMLFPPLIKLGNLATDIMNKLTDFSEAYPELSTNITYVVAALMGLFIVGRLLSFLFAGLRMGILPLIGLFLKFNKAGQNVAIGWRLLAGAGRLVGSVFRIAGAGLKGFASGALEAGRAAVAAQGKLRTLSNLARSGMAASWMWKIGFDIIDDFGRTPEERIEQIRKNHEAWQNLEKQVDESWAGGIWQGMKDKANDLMGLERGVIPAEALSAWASSKAAQFNQIGSEWIDALLKGVQASWDTVTTWFSEKIAALKELFSFDMNINWPEPPEWLSWLWGKGKEADKTASSWISSLGIGGSQPALIDGKPATPSYAGGPAKPNTPWYAGGAWNPDKVEQTINAEVIDKRPPNVTVHAPISISGVVDPQAAGRAAAAQLGKAIANAKSGSLHGGTED
ncbi:phage tail tape measure protein [Ochrobactrum sp. MR28]|nr:phage tail tape measure protein [Ochrobactrum sp. MR28]MBX8816994.1 phage tail tape measure protein [Ochrobactrum sp. MR31]